MRPGEERERRVSDKERTTSCKKHSISLSLIVRSASFTLGCCRLTGFLRHPLSPPTSVRSGGPVGAEVTEEPRDQGAGGWRTGETETRKHGATKVTSGRPS